MNVKELCVQTPVARTTFYEYYDNLGTLKAEIEDELIGGILKIAKATAGGSFVEMNLNVFFAQTLDYIKSHWEENYAFLVAQPNLAYIAKWKDAIKYHFRPPVPRERCCAKPRAYHGSHRLGSYWCVYLLDGAS